MSPGTHPAGAASRSELLNDATLAVVVFALSLVLLAASGGGLQNGRGVIDAPGVALTALATLPLIARHRSPLAVFVLTATASVALRAVAEPAGPPLGPTVALFFVAAGEQSRGRTRLTFALAAILVAAHAAAMALTTSSALVTPIVFGILVWGGAWLAGDRARLRSERMAELEQRALRAEQDAQRERRLATAEERTRIARDLHDSAGHAINVILVHAGMGRLRAQHDAGVREIFGTIEDVARQTVADIDQLVSALREDDAQPAVEPPPGLAALDGLLERHRAAGLDVITTIRGDPGDLSPSVDRGAYRILQEALTNTARHGDGKAEVNIAVGQSTLEVSVINPVCLTTRPRQRGGGHGLVGMRERAALLGGSLEATVQNGRFHLHVRLPLASGRA